MFDEKTNGFDSGENQNESGGEKENTSANESGENCEVCSSNDRNSDFSDDVIPSTAEECSDNTTEEKSFDNSDFNTSSEIYGGTPYTKDDGTESKSGYEWNSGVNRDSELKSKPATDKKNKSSKGFRVFLGCLLTVFTLSAVTLTAMVAHQIISDNTNDNKNQVFSQDKENDNPDKSVPEKNASASSSNYVAFDADELEGKALTLPQIAAKCSPSSVGIVSEVEVSYSYSFGFGSTKRTSEASGSGFIYSSDGYIITNHHVIEGAKKVTVILHDGTEYEAEIVGSDSLSDIAVLKIVPEEDVTLVPMEIGNSDELVVGETVVAIGCPAGIEFIGTVTDGIVSAINRNVEITDDYGTTQKTMTLIQTNATINHGNSGGPLINTKGQVIGINTLKLSSSSYEGIGFSIPMNGAMPIIKQLIEHGKVVERTQDDFAYGKGVIGITGTAISDDESEYFNIPKGVLVSQIDKNSSASKAGLRRGDIITHYNGKEVSTVSEINEAKGSARAGEEVTVTVYRDSADGKGETVDITFTLDAQN